MRPQTGIHLKILWEDLQEAHRKLAGSFQKAHRRLSASSQELSKLSGDSQEALGKVLGAQIMKIIGK